ncbi:MAG: flagellar biosynthetic protein FliO [Pirellula sp.]
MRFSKRSAQSTLQCVVTLAMGIGSMMPLLAQNNHPSIAYPPSYSLSPTSPHNPNILEQPNGQRIFNLPPTQAANSLAPPTQNTIPSPPSNVQRASWTADSKANSLEPISARVPIELKVSPKDSKPGVDKPRSTWAATLSMFFSLSVVLSLFLAVAWLFRKSQPNAFVKLSKDVVQVMGRASMAPRQQIYVVRFGNKMILVSHQPGQTQTLAEITDSTEVERLAGLCEANQPTSITHSFRDVLNQVALGRNDDTPHSKRERKPSLTRS